LATAPIPCSYIYSRAAEQSRIVLRPMLQLAALDLFLELVVVDHMLCVLTAVSSIDVEEPAAAEFSQWQFCCAGRQGHCHCCCKLSSHRLTFGRQKAMIATCCLVNVYCSSGASIQCIQFTRLLGAVN
jgi:hypothetical protein